MAHYFLRGKLHVYFHFFTSVLRHSVDVVLVELTTVAIMATRANVSDFIEVFGYALLHSNEVLNATEVSILSGIEHTIYV